MNFEFSSDQKLLKDQARKFLEGEESLKKAREVLENDAPYDESLWKSIIELGWTATTIPEEYDDDSIFYYINEGLHEVEKYHILGKNITPFMLKYI